MFAVSTNISNEMPVENNLYTVPVVNVSTDVQHLLLMSVPTLRSFLWQHNLAYFSSFEIEYYEG